MRENVPPRAWLTGKDFYFSLYENFCPSSKG